MMKYILIDSMILGNILFTYPTFIKKIRFCLFYKGNEFTSSEKFLFDKQGEDKNCTNKHRQRKKKKMTLRRERN